MARTRTGEPAALDAPAPAGRLGNMADLQAELRATLLAGGDTAAIRQAIAEAEEHANAQAALLDDLQGAAGARLAACSATRASARVFGSNADLAARLAKLVLPPHPFRR